MNAARQWQRYDSIEEFLLRRTIRFLEVSAKSAASYVLILQLFQPKWLYLASIDPIMLEWMHSFCYIDRRHAVCENSICFLIEDNNQRWNASRDLALGFKCISGNY
jgi:hypothetical protein